MYENMMSGYNPYGNTYGNSYNDPYSWSRNAPNSQYSQRRQIIRVNGENGARAYNMAPNSSVLLLDENMPIVWLAQTDGAGYKTVTPYTIAPYQAERPVDTKSLEMRVQKLEEMISGKSDITNAKPKRSKTTADSTAE